MGRTLLSAAFDLDFAGVSSLRCGETRTVESEPESSRSSKSKSKTTSKAGDRSVRPPPTGLAGGRRYLEAAFSVVSPTCKKIVNTGFTYPGHSSGGSKLYQTVAGAEQEL